MKFVFLVFLLCFICLQFLQADALGNETDEIALLKFKEKIASDPNKIFASWNNTLPFCNWLGVSCSSRHGRVTSLVLEGLNLVGTISPFIGNLSFLRIINLRNNGFHGEIPQDVGRLFRLQQFLVNNNTLEGGIPSNLSHCSDLRLISLQWNKLSGNIPSEFGSLRNLRGLQLFVNNLTGEIPASLTNISTLVVFHVSRNNLVGSIPDEIGRLTNLTTFAVGGNNLSGVIPPLFFNISSMINLEVTHNNLTGSLPENFGLTLPNLKFFGYGENNFIGSIPKSLSNSSRIELIDLGWNNFVGQVPTNLGNMKNLWRIRLHGNDLGSNSTNDLAFITSMTNCTNLKILDFGRNNLGGEFPNSVANLSTQLNLFYFGFNHITGTIPPGLENFINLTGLVMHYNLFTGSIPSYFGKFQQLQVLDVTGNRFSGQIPSSLYNLTGLSELYLSENNLHGTLPASIGNLRNLNIFAISQNNLSGAVPRELLLISSLSRELDLSGNSFTGSLPQEIGKLTSLTKLDISGNNLSGSVPSSIGDCLSLEYLYMQHNSFQGTMPSSLDSLKGLRRLDLSRNNLTGKIVDLQSFQFLIFLNLSFNDLEGALPTQGIFRNASAFSVTANSKLCGGIPELNLPKCPDTETKKGKSLAYKLALTVPFVGLAVVLFLIFLLVYFKRKSSDERSSSASPLNEISKRSSSLPRMMNLEFVKVAYRDLHQATDGFSSGNLIGSGSFGSVYKGSLDQVQRPVAIKVLKLEIKGASKSFLAECKVLRNVRHRNLVKMLTYCSSVDYRSNEFKALVFEYMENGSLDTWLHPDSNGNEESQSKNLNLLERLNIAIDVASALHYLHDLCKSPIIHSDLKPSNVLLDDDLVARVCDFGLSRLLSTSNSSSQSQFSTDGLIKGTIGYTAPEYGTGSGVSKGGDVYSYGILLLEMFSGRRPTDEMFREGLNLHDFVKRGLRENLIQIVDRNIFNREISETKTGIKEDGEDGKKVSKISEMVLISVLEIGVICSAESSKKRMRMGDVVGELQLIKNAFLENRDYF
ncbi:Receptor kinase-like protein Xa21 [Euphorbia peplus]|nr:Receptor kinase-like protein Xa21 [Euphorbia peplus]